MQRSGLGLGTRDVLRVSPVPLRGTIEAESVRGTGRRDFPEPTTRHKTGNRCRILGYMDQLGHEVIIVDRCFTSKCVVVDVSPPDVIERIKEEGGLSRVEGRALGGRVPLILPAAREIGSDDGDDDAMVAAVPDQIFAIGKYTWG